MCFIFKIAFVAVYFLMGRLLLFFLILQDILPPFFIRSHKLLGYETGLTGQTQSDGLVPGDVKWHLHVSQPELPPTASSSCGHFLTVGKILSWPSPLH